MRTSDRIVRRTQDTTGEPFTVSTEPLRPVAKKLLLFLAESDGILYGNDARGYEAQNGVSPLTAKVLNFSKAAVQSLRQHCYLTRRDRPYRLSLLGRAEAKRIKVKKEGKP